MAFHLANSNATPHDVSTTDISFCYPALLYTVVVSFPEEKQEAREGMPKSLLKSTSLDLDADP